MVGWHHRLSGYGFEQTSADGKGQGGLACCNLWGHKELDMTEQLSQLKTVSFCGDLSGSNVDVGLRRISDAPGIVKGQDKGNQIEALVQVRNVKRESQ